ncbi:MAG TPA: FAD-dependent oxidoreductase [Flavobacteriales bacterium]|nr:FAD-dependent oxidoreductase [Flavobacteriales bacterium]
MKSKIPKIVSIVIVTSLVILGLYSNSKFVNYDLVVYGASPAGISAAVAASEEGLNSVLIASGSSVGGTMSNGLSASDIGVSSSVTGLPLRFFNLVRAHYGDDYIKWRFESHIAEEVFQVMLKASGVKLIMSEPISSVEFNNQEINCIKTKSRKVCGKYFIDASYEGDLIAKSGAKHVLGLEDYLAHDEPLAALRHITKVVKLGGGKGAHRQNPFIAEDRKDISKGMPSITYRTCITDKESNKNSFKRTDKYDDYLPFWRSYMQGADECDRCGEVKTTSIGSIHSYFYQIAKLPNGKFDLNSGSSSFMNVPATPEYFKNLSERYSFQSVLTDYMKNWFYFLQNDNTVPKKVADNFSVFGLCADEFVNNDNWPLEPYLREGRRILGRYTITQKDIFTSRKKNGSIAIGSYHLDSKPAQVFVENEHLFRDVNSFLTTPPYEIPYWALIPKKGPKNLLATIGLSASPTAYGSIRMEPQYMAIGEAAGVAAAVAERKNTSLYELSYKDIQDTLRARNVIFNIDELCKKIPKKYRTKVGYSRQCKLIYYSPKDLTVKSH